MDYLQREIVTSRFRMVAASGVSWRIVVLHCRLLMHGLVVLNLFFVVIPFFTMTLSFAAYESSIQHLGAELRHLVHEWRKGTIHGEKGLASRPPELKGKSLFRHPYPHLVLAGRSVGWIAAGARFTDDHQYESC